MTRATATSGGRQIRKIEWMRPARASWCMRRQASNPSPETEYLGAQSTEGHPGCCASGNSPTRCAPPSPGRGRPGPAARATSRTPPEPGPADAGAIVIAAAAPPRAKASNALSGRAMSTKALGRQATGAGTAIAGSGRPAIGAEPPSGNGQRLNPLPAHGILRMLYFARWKILLICAICALGVLLTICCELRRCSTGCRILCRTGGCCSTLVQQLLSAGKVDGGGRPRAALNSLVDGIANAAVAAGINTGLTVKDDAIVFAIRQPSASTTAWSPRRRSTPVDRHDWAGPEPAARCAGHRWRPRRAAAPGGRPVDPRSSADASTKPAPSRPSSREGKTAILVNCRASTSSRRCWSAPPSSAFNWWTPAPRSRSAQQLAPPRATRFCRRWKRRRARRPRCLRRAQGVGGDVLVDAQPSFSRNNEPVVSFRFDAEGRGDLATR